VQIRAASRLVLILLASCSVYDPSLLEGSGGSGGGGSGGATGGGGQGGAPVCHAPTDCPGADDECQQRTCVMGSCGVVFTALGTALSTQTPGDCQKVVCDGLGGTTQEPEDSDTPDDGKECTTDTCAQGVPMYTPVTASTACTQGGGKVCNDLGACVECVTGADCPSMVCDATFTCAPPGCTDMVKNGLETDVDCGGGVCADCPSGKACKLDGDCIGGSCAMSVCAPTCTDKEKNNGESDVDCGGPNCGKCDFGKQCAGGGDCDTGNCQGGACACVGTCACDHLVISELRTRGASGASDEFVELYNTTASPITLDNEWKLEVRSSSASNYVSRWVGAGQVIAPKGHLLITGSAYNQMPASFSEPEEQMRI